MGTTTAATRLPGNTAQTQFALTVVVVPLLGQVPVVAAGSKQTAQQHSEGISTARRATWRARPAAGKP